MDKMSKQSKRNAGGLWLRAAAAVLCAIVFFASCTDVPGQTEKKRYQAEYLTLFDTVTTIIGYADSEEQFGEIAQNFHDEMEQYHQLYDIYNDYSGVNNIKTINDNAGKAPVMVDERIISLLLKAKEMYCVTDGRMNVAFGSVLSIWHDYRTEGIDDPQAAELPPMEKLRAASEHVDISKVEIDEAAKTVFLPDSAMRLDVGAIGKGYAVQKVVDSMRAQGYNNILVSVGGNICAIGSKLQEQDWIVGIQNPDTDSDDPYVCKVAIKSGSVVTSGDYQRYYTVDGERYSHIIDRDTLMPAKNFRAVSLLCEDSGDADALSTAIYCMTYEEGLRFVADYRAKSGMALECMWVMEDGEKRYTEGFKSKLYEN